MAEKKPKFSKRIFFIVLAFAFSMAFFSYPVSLNELEKKPIIYEKIQERDIKYIFNFYFSGEPNIKDTALYGNKNAGITMAAFIDFESENSKHFIKNIFPDIKKEYIDTGKMKFYHKTNIIPEDADEVSDNFVYALSLVCVKDLNENVYFDFYFDLFDIEKKEQIFNLLEKYQIEKELFLECLKNKDRTEIKESLSETEQLGIVGINPKFYIGINGNDNTVIEGIPDIEKFREVIRRQELILGY